MNRALMVGEPTSNRVPESDEMRKDMPKASALDDDPSVFDPLRRTASRPNEDDDRIEMIFRTVAVATKEGEEAQYEEQEVPVIGSFHTRHLTLARNLQAFFLGEKWMSAPEDEALV